MFAGDLLSLGFRFEADEVGRLAHTTLKLLGAGRDQSGLLDGGPT